MSIRRWLSALAVAGLLVTAGSAFAQAEKKPPKDPNSFGTLRAPTAEQARAQSAAWLKGIGKMDDAAFNTVWSQDQKSVLDKVADTFALGDDAAKKLLAEARDPNAPAPTAVPAPIKAAKDPFFKNNLALAYARALSNRRVHEEALDILKTAKPEMVVDPSAYLFHKAVAEHALLMKNEASDTIVRLLDDVLDLPERYKMVSGLMLFDMANWRDKDLGWIARKMDNIERRLELARGGPQTQKIQKEVVARLDEIIKELENRQSGCGD